MVEQLLLLFQALFLVLLYVFVWRLVRSASRDLRLPQEESFILAPARSSAAELARGRLVVESSTSLADGSSYTIGETALMIGRSPENSVVLDRDAYASARHARVEPLRDGVWVVDLESRNGTFVNDERVEGRRALAPGDVVQVGETRLRLEP